MNARQPAAPHPAQTALRVAMILSERIDSGSILPGSKLGEQALADELDVSRNTLREAFAQLANDGLVERIPHRGVFVASPGAEGVREIYRVRRLVEPAALLWAEISEDVVEGLGRIVERAVGARSARDVAGMAAANQDFHRRIVGVTGSPTLAEMMDRVLARMRLVFFAMQDRPDFHSHYVELNEELLRLLRLGQREQAADIMRRYLDEAERELLAHLEAPSRTR